MRRIPLAVVSLLAAAILILQLPGLARSQGLEYWVVTLRILADSTGTPVNASPSVRTEWETPPPMPPSPAAIGVFYGSGSVPSEEIPGLGPVPARKIRFCAEASGFGMNLNLAYGGPEADEAPAINNTFTVQTGPAGDPLVVVLANTSATTQTVRTPAGTSVLAPGEGVGIPVSGPTFGPYPVDITQPGSGAYTMVLSGAPCGDQIPQPNRGVYLPFVVQR